MFAEQLQAALVERRANEIDAVWIKGIRKSWKKAIQPVIRLSSRVPHSATKIDIEKIQRTADESVAALKKVADYLQALRQDLLFNKGLWTIRRPEKGKAQKDPAAKAVHELDAAEKAIKDNISRVEHWKDMMTPGSFAYSMDDGRMYHRASTELKDFNIMLNSVCPTGKDTSYEGWVAADSAISRRLLSVISSKTKSMGGTIALDPVEPEVVHLGKVTVVFQDTPPHGSPARLSPKAHTKGEWRSPQQRKEYLRFFKVVPQLLRKHKLSHLWYGKLFVFPRASAGPSPYGKEWGVGGSYSRAKDCINVYNNPSSFLIELIIHELAHRYYLKFMSAQERANFDKWFSVVPATSKYGAINSSEDFAEVFADYVMGKKLNRAQVQRLKVFFGRKRKMEHREEKHVDFAAAPRGDCQ